MKKLRKKLEKALIRIINRRNAKMEKKILQEVWDCQNIKNLSELQDTFINLREKICVKMYDRNLSEEQGMRLYRFAGRIYRQRKRELERNIIPLEKKNGLLVAAR